MLERAGPLVRCYFNLYTIFRINPSASNKPRLYGEFMPMDCNSLILGRDTPGASNTIIHEPHELVKRKMCAKCELCFFAPRVIIFCALSWRGVLSRRHPVMVDKK